MVFRFYLDFKIYLIYCLRKHYFLMSPVFPFSSLCVTITHFLFLSGYCVFVCCFATFVITCPTLIRFTCLHLFSPVPISPVCIYSCLALCYWLGCLLFHLVSLLVVSQITVVFAQAFWTLFRLVILFLVVNVAAKPASWVLNFLPLYNHI